MEQAITVSQLNRYIKLKFEHDIRLNNIYVCGEISNFTNHIKSGHFYFTLKDSQSAIKAVMFRQNAVNVKFIPKDGMKVIVRGQISSFERDGTYQIYVCEIIPDGIGNLSIAFEQLKEKLASEGLFNAEHKKSLPPYPEKIGIITSENGAALQDMLNIFLRRYPICKLFLYPALVQGSEAAESIISGIDYFEKAKSVDIIVIGRGGGSIEDLWCFNDEKLAYAVYNSEIPIVSCVGHETDFTICDFVADLRAPTPSAAAELCVPNYEDILYQIDSMISRSEAAINKKILLLSEKLISLQKRPSISNMDFYVSERIRRLENIKKHPVFNSPDFILSKRTNRLNEAKLRLTDLSEKLILKYESMLSSKAYKLDALSPLKILSRGYALPTVNGVQITSENLETDDIFDLKFFDGEIKAKVISKKGDVL